MQFALSVMHLPILAINEMPHTLSGRFIYAIIACLSWMHAGLNFCMIVAITAPI